MPPMPFSASRIACWSAQPRPCSGQMRSGLLGLRRERHARRTLPPRDLVLYYRHGILMRYSGMNDAVPCNDGSGLRVMADGFLPGEVGD